MYYKFAILDPCKTPAAIEANEKIFASGPVYGIEVTVPELAARCIGNLDPQHTGKNAELAAIEAALEVELPPDNATLVTVRADLDSIGAMVVLDSRLYNEINPPGFPFTDPPWPWNFREFGAIIMDRVKAIAKADKFSRGEWPGATPLPNKENPWPEGSASAETSKPLAAIAAAVADFKVPIAKRVEMLEEWIRLGEEPIENRKDIEQVQQVFKPYREQVEKERLELIAALESGKIKVEGQLCNEHLSARIAIVQTTHRAATMIGYSVAPVVIALNPSFSFNGGAPIRKFTICQFTDKYMDMKKALAELSTLEAGWGGSPTIGGSPQGISSILTIEQIVEVVAKHLKQ